MNALLAALADYALISTIAGGLIAYTLGTIHRPARGVHNPRPFVWGHRGVRWVIDEDNIGVNNDAQMDRPVHGVGGQLRSDTPANEPVMLRWDAQEVPRTSMWVPVQPLTRGRHAA